jgi:hypothetical protein
VLTLLLIRKAAIPAPPMAIISCGRACRMTPNWPAADQVAAEDADEQHHEADDLEHARGTPKARVRRADSSGHHGH